MHFLLLGIIIHGPNFPVRTEGKRCGEEVSIIHDPLIGW